MPQNESDVMLRMRVLAGEIYTQRVYADYILRQMFPSTAVGEYLDAHAAQRGLTRKGGTKAVGRALFYAPAEEHDDVLIPAGTVVSTADGLRFVADSDTILHDGDLAVTVNVTAAHPGSAYNIIGNRLTVIVTPVMGIESVRNTVSISGGTDDESDEQLRERIADSFRNISNGANAAYYHSVAMSVDGVYTASVVGAARGAGTVDVYVCAKGEEFNRKSKAWVCFVEGTDIFVYRYDCLSKEDQLNPQNLVLMLNGRYDVYVDNGTIYLVEQ